MSMNRYKPEQIVELLRQIEVAVANGKITLVACEEAGITAQTYYRSRKDYGGFRGTLPSGHHSGLMDGMGAPMKDMMGSAGKVGRDQAVLDGVCGAALPAYILITPARNEGAFIEKTIQSMIRQTVLPLKWVVVDDGSTDDTPEIVSRYLAAHPWIELVRRPQRTERNFAGKVYAFNAGLSRTQNLPWEIVGNLDGDISFDPDHFEFLLGRFAADPELGVAGTAFREDGFSLERDVFQWTSHVGGQCQLFRRQCFDAIGGYVPVPTGGIDWVAVINARMKGWKTRSFAERQFFHHRPMGTAERGRLASSFAYGKKDYSVGSHPMWELFRVVRRLARRPYLLSGLALGAGYCWAWFCRTPRAVSQDLVRFHRNEQMKKLQTFLKAGLLASRSAKDSQ